MIAHHEAEEQSGLPTHVHRGVVERKLSVALLHPRREPEELACGGDVGRAVEEGVIWAADATPVRLDFLRRFLHQQPVTRSGNERWRLDSCRARESVVGERNRKVWDLQRRLPLPAAVVAMVAWVAVDDPDEV